MSLEWSPGERLTPWLVLDLPRAAWLVEKRAAELTLRSGGSYGMLRLEYWRL
jgi:hypothetical protein